MNDVLDKPLRVREEFCLTIGVSNLSFVWCVRRNKYALNRYLSIRIWIFVILE